MLPIKLKDQEYEQLKTASRRLKQPMSHIIRRHLQPIISPNKTVTDPTNHKSNKLIEFVSDNAVSADTSITSDKLDNYLYGEQK